MPTNKQFIGKEYPPFTYVIGEEKIKEYAISVGDLNPLYTDSDYAKKSKYSSIIAPPMFIVVYAKEAMDMLFNDKELKLNMARLVHGEQEFNFHKAVRANDIIKTTGKIKNIYEKNNNDFLELETKSYNQNNEKVSDGVWIFIIRG